MKKAYVFPGQGAQFPGMAKEVYEKSQKAKEMFEKANEILGFRITDIMFDGTPEALKATKVTQPAIFLHSVVLTACYDQFQPDMVAGHSLGEFSALAASHAIAFEDALKLVSIRAKAMQKCCEQMPGSMAAIIGLTNEQVEDLCKSCHGLVIPANYNCDGQVEGAKRALPLAVSGAFHSPLMEPARVELGAAIEATEIKAPICPIYQNVTAQPTQDPELIKKNLLAQLTAPVKWTQSVKNMLADEADYFMEIGPGKVLQGLVKRIAGSIVTVEGLETL